MLKAAVARSNGIGKDLLSRCVNTNGSRTTAYSHTPAWKGIKDEECQWQGPHPTPPLYQTELSYFTTALSMSAGVRKKGYRERMYP